MKSAPFLILGWIVLIAGIQAGLVIYYLGQSRKAIETAAAEHSLELKTRATQQMIFLDSRIRID